MTTYKKQYRLIGKQVDIPHEIKVNENIIIDWTDEDQYDKAIFREAGKAYLKENDWDNIYTVHRFVKI